jgi:UDP-N-acetylmuramoyl-tripeptide--D-alanyl-D-alanine ligase
MRNRAIFLDRDGTIIVDKGYIYRTEEIDLLPKVIDALQIFQKKGYLLIVITNQSGVGRGYYKVEDVILFNNALKCKLKKYNVIINDFFVCMHTPDDKCICRKPSPYLINKAIAKYSVDPEQSFMFGDKYTDVICGENAHVRSFLITEEHSLYYWSKVIEKNEHGI